MDRLRRLQFLEIMEESYDESVCGPFLFKSGYVQAALVTVDRDKMNLLKSFLQKDICHIFPYGEHMVFLFEDMPETAVKHLLNNIHGYLEKNKLCSAITLGSRCLEKESYPGEGIRTTCREAQELMTRIFFYHGKKYLSLDDIQNKQNTVINENNDEEVKKLCTYIQIVDYIKIRAFFKELAAAFFHSGKSSQEIRRECITLMIRVRSEIIQKFPPLKEMLGSGKEIFDAIMDMRYLETIINAMTDATLYISERLPLLSADLGFQRIISYVNNNYHQDLRLDSLGQLFNYNCAYLGKCFKEHTGKMFHRYLNMLRINAAKELLQTTSMKVYEISNAVGYTNTDYFYVKFKRFTGKSPLDYRKKQSAEIVQKLKFPNNSIVVF